MPDVQLGVVLRHVRKLVRAPAAEEPSDSQLLDRFVRRRDQAAFAALMARHGPLVLGACRRLLLNPTDADDAFQATFLVLVRRAGSLRGSGSLGSWLYGVAYRVALKMRRSAARRGAHEGRAASMARTAFETEPAADDLRPALDEELNRLPEKCRAALVACYLEGRTHAQAAEQLGWPRGSLAKRLARGLELLRLRLARRGLALSAAGLAAVLANQASAVPPALAHATLQAAVLAAAGKVLTGAVSSQILSAVEATMRDLLLARVKSAALLVLGLCVLGAGVGALGGAPAAPEAPAAAREAPRPEARLDADDEPLPDGALARLGSLRLRHGGPVTSVAFSPDGKLLATGSWDLFARLWDRSTGRRVRDIVPGDWVWAVAFSPDGKLLATASGRPGNKVSLRDVETGQVVRTFEGHTEQVRGLSYAPDGKSIASASFDGTVRLWDAETGKELRRITPGDPPTLRCVTFSPDGKTLATAGGGGGVRLWEAATGKGAGQVGADQRGVVSAAWSKDGKRLVGGSEDGTVTVWDVAGAKALHSVRGKEMPALGVAFAPDGKTFAAGYGDWDERRWGQPDGGVVLWDAASGKVARRLEDRMSLVQAIAFAPDGKALAAVTVHCSILTWDPTTGKRLVEPAGHQAGVKAVAFAGGRTLATAGHDHTVPLWDLGKNESRLVLGDGQATPGALAVSPDRRRLAWGGADGALRLCDAATGKEERRLDGHAGHALAVAFAPDGKALASGGADRTVRLWDAQTGKELRALEGHADGVIALAFAPSGRLLASGSVDRTVRLWDVASGKELRKLEGHTFEVSTVVFSPDGRTLASASRDDSVRLWEVATGRLRWHFGPGKIGRAAVAFSPDGRLLLTATSDQGRGIRLWDAAGTRELCKVWGHRGFATAVAFAPDGKTMATASDDSTVLLWDVAALRSAAAQPAPLSAADLEATWGDLLGNDAVRAYTARGTLAGVPGQALPLLKEVLKPVLPADADKVRRLIKELDDDDFATRERATAELHDLAEAAEADLRKALEGATAAEVRERLKRVLDADGRAASPERLRQERALEVLEAAGTSAAEKLLRELAKGAPPAWLTREAQAALDRAAKR